MSTTFHQKPNLYISHVQLKVSNLERSLAFYTQVIGFQVLKQVDKVVYLTVDGQQSLVSLKEVEKAIDPNRHAGLYHIALLLPTRKDLGNVLHHFANNNVRIGAGDHHVSEALYLNDPDGNGIEIYADRPTDYWKWSVDNQVYMTTEHVDIPSVMAEGDGQWNGLPKGTVMGHIHLAVSHLKKAEQFYTNVLDYEVVTRYGNQALFISTGKYHHHIGMNTWHTAGSEPTKEDEVGLAYYTIVLKDAQYANEVKQKLIANHYSVVDVQQNNEANDFGGAPMFYTVDTSGIKVMFSIND